jgi:hypothetical protein
MVSLHRKPKGFFYCRADRFMGATRFNSAYKASALTGRFTAPVRISRWVTPRPYISRLSS